MLHSTPLKTPHSTTMEFTDLIAGLASELKVADFFPNEEGRCALLFETVQVDFEHDAKHNQLVIRSTPFTLEIADEEALEKLLAANKLGIENGDCVISIDENNRVWFTRRWFMASLTFDQLMHDLSYAVHQLKRWQNLQKTDVQLDLNPLFDADFFRG